MTVSDHQLTEHPFCLSRGLSTACAQEKEVTSDKYSMVHLWLTSQQHCNATLKNLSLSQVYLLLCLLFDFSHSHCPLRECAQTLVIDVICPLRECEKYAQHLIRNLKNTRTGLALLLEAHSRLKLEVFVLFVGNFELPHWTAVIYSVNSRQGVQETLSFLL